MICVCRVVHFALGVAILAVGSSQLAGFNIGLGILCICTFLVTFFVLGLAMIGGIEV